MIILNISKNPTKASNYLVMGYTVKAPLKRGVEVAMNANPIEDIVYKAMEYCLIVGYNTYAPGFQKAAKGNDMIDAYLYINPSYGVRKINVT